MIILPLISVVVSFVLTVMVFKQYAARRKPYQLMWGMAFLMFSIASLAETVALSSGWTPVLLKTYYLFGASLLVGYLGLGTIYLLWGGKLAQISLGIVLVLSVISVGLIFQAQANDANIAKLNQTIVAKAQTANYETGEVKVADGLDKHWLLRAITIALNIIGSLVLIGGAGYSAFNAFKKGAPKNIFYGTGLIAAGSFVIASGGTAAGIGGFAGQIVLSAAIAVGIIIMFAGFLFTNQKPKEKVA